MECRSFTEEPAAPMPDPQAAAAEFSDSEGDFFPFDVQPDATTDSNIPMSVETKIVMDYLKCKV